MARSRSPSRARWPLGAGDPRAASRRGLERLDARAGAISPKRRASSPGTRRGSIARCSMGGCRGAPDRARGPDDPAELEAIASVFELVVRRSAGNPRCCARSAICTCARSDGPMRARRSTKRRRPAARSPRRGGSSIVRASSWRRARMTTRSRRPSAGWRATSCGTRPATSSATCSSARWGPPGATTRRSPCSTCVPPAAVSACRCTIGWRASGWRAGTSRGRRHTRTRRRDAQHPRHDLDDRGAARCELRADRRRAARRQTRYRWPRPVGACRAIRAAN